MIYALIAGWWLVGFASAWWLRRDDPMTWGGLFVVAMIGLLGPILFVLVALVVLLQAEFWSKPIFPQKRQ